MPSPSANSRTGLPAIAGAQGPELTVALGPKGMELAGQALARPAGTDCIAFKTVALKPGEMLTRVFAEPFDLAELSFSNYVIEMERGTCGYRALPVYLSRSFRFGDFYLRTDRGIAVPADLRGRRVGIRSYHHTAYVWARALLRHEYGVAPEEVTWVREAEHHGGAGAGEPLPPRSAVVADLAQGDTLSAALERGDIDAAISPRPLPCFESGSAAVARLFRHPEEEAARYFGRTGIFPILHVLGIRRSLLDGKIQQRIFDLFAGAAGSGPGAGDGQGFGLGVEDRLTIEAFLQFHAEQGLSSRSLGRKDLFLQVDG